MKFDRGAIALMKLGQENQKDGVEDRPLQFFRPIAPYRLSSRGK